MVEARFKSLSVLYHSWPMYCGTGYGAATFTLVISLLETNFPFKICRLPSYEKTIQDNKKGTATHIHATCNMGIIYHLTSTNQEDYINFA